MSGKTWPKILENYYNQYGIKRVAMRKKELGIWREYTWKDYYENVKYFSLGMMQLDLKNYDMVMLIGYNKPYLYFSILGVMAAHGIPTIISPDSKSTEVKEFMIFSDSRFVIVENQEQVEKILSIRSELPKLEKIIYWNPKGLLDHDQKDLLSYQNIVKNGKDFDKTHQGFFEKLIETLSEDDIAFLIYTSGTAASAKGVLITHRAAIKSAEKCIEAGKLKESFQIFSHLPLAWFPALIMEMGIHLIGGMTVNFPEAPDTVLKDIREIGPNFVVFTPRQWESIVRMVRTKMREAGFLKRLCYKVFLPVGYKVIERNMKVNFLWKFFYLLASLLLFRPLRNKLGFLHVKLSLTGGWPINIESFKFLNAIGLNLKQFYGMTEVNPITWQTEGDLKWGSVGKPVYGTEVIISKEGEILVKADHMFSGYYKDSIRTEEILKEGRMRTGDVGRIDSDGNLIYEGRISEMIQTYKGERFSQEWIEGVLRYNEFIKDALILKKNKIIALIQIDFEAVGKWAEKNDIKYITFSDLSKKSEVYELIGKIIQEINQILPERMKIEKYFLIHKEFSSEDLELTHSGKLRRNFVIEKYRHIWEKENPET